MHSTKNSVGKILLVGIIFALVIADVVSAASTTAKARTAKKGAAAHPQPHTAKTKYQQQPHGATNIISRSGARNPQELEQDVMESPSTAPVIPSMLMSSRYITNSTNYLGIVSDNVEVLPVTVGYTLGIFGYVPSPLSDPVSGVAEGERDGFGPGDTASLSYRRSNGGRKKSQNSGKVNSNNGVNKNKKSKGTMRAAEDLLLDVATNHPLDDDAPRQHSTSSSPTNEFNIYSGFMASPGEVLAAVSGEDKGYSFNGIDLTLTDYNLYNPHAVSSMNELNWTTIYATIVIAFKTKDIPQNIQLSDGIIAVLTALIAPNNQSSVNSAAAFSIPDEESGPVYDAQVINGDGDGETGTFGGSTLSLSVDKDWYSGMTAAKRRAGKLAKFKAGNSRKAVTDEAANEHLPAGEETENVYSSSDIDDDDLLVISINVVIPNADYAAKDAIVTPVTDPHIIVDSTNCDEVLVWLDGSRLFVSNCVTAGDLFIDTDFHTGKQRTPWYITASISCVVLILVTIGTIIFSNQGMGKPFIVENENAFRFYGEPINSSAPMIYDMDTSYITDNGDSETFSPPPPPPPVLGTFASLPSPPSVTPPRDSLTDIMNTLGVNAQIGGFIVTPKKDSSSASGNNKKAPKKNSNNSNKDKPRD